MAAGIADCGVSAHHGWATTNTVAAWQRLNHRESCLGISEGGRLMAPSQGHPGNPQGLHRRDVLKAGLATSVTLSTLPLARPAVLWGTEAGQPKRGGILRVWGSDPPHFDPHLLYNAKTHTAL